jgi:hypothetical protein
MVTANIDVEDGLVNGVIGILQYIEQLTENRTAEEDEEGRASNNVPKSKYIIWLQF